MNSSWATDIDKFMIWHHGGWAKTGCTAVKLILRVHFDQLLITSENKILESLNMHCKMKGFYKEDVLIIIINGINHEMRKLKFRIRSNAPETLQKLSEHFPIAKYETEHSRNIVLPKYGQIKEVFINSLESKGADISINFPSGYKNFVKLCLLDPAFPKFVQDTEEIFKDLVKE